MTVLQVKSEFKIGDLNIQSIEGTSGLFIGQTVANNWQSKSKTNQAFGSITQALGKGLIGIIQDNDQFDMINHDNKATLISRSGFNNFKDVVIRVNGVNLNVMETNAAISIGENQQNQWETKGKHNFGTGRMIGKNGLKQIVNTIDDRDGFDFISKSKSYTRSEKEKEDEQKE